MRFSVVVAFVCAMVLSVLAVPAHAQATRTWVSGVGDDANPCSRTAPCKTWAGAISKTAAGGEIDGLDPGGFGSLTITKSMTIDGGNGNFASTLATSTNGFNVSAASTDVVIIRNLQFNQGNTAIQLNTAAVVVVENCNIFGFTNNGIAVAPSTAAMRVAISNTHIQNVATVTGNAAVLVAPTGGQNASVSISNSYIEQALNGVFVSAGSSGAVNVNVKNSVLTFFGNNGVTVASGGATAKGNVFGTQISYGNNAGVVVGGTNATLKLGENSITNNVTGVVGSSTALLSYKNNMISDNNTDGTPITAVTGYASNTGQ